MYAFFTLLVLVVTPLALAQNGTLAIVGNTKITVQDFKTKFDEAVRSAPINPPTKSQFLEDLIRYEMGVQEAEKKNLRQDPLVQERIKQEIYKALLEKEIGERINSIKVTEAEMKAWYRKNPEVRTSHILIQYKADSTAKEIDIARKRALEIYQKVKNSKRSFEENVKLYSDDTLSKQNNGDVGWHSRMTLVPSYYNTAVNLKVNQVSGLVQTPFGFHIIKLLGKRSYENANKQQIRAAVFDVKRKQVFDRFFASVRKEYKVRVNEKLLEKLK